MLEEGLETRFARHRRNPRARCKAGLAAHGHRVRQPRRATTCRCSTRCRIPDGVDDVAVRQRLLNDYGIEIGGGLGAFKGKAWRIGLMGETSTERNVLLFLAALEACLESMRRG